MKLLLAIGCLVGLYSAEGNTDTLQGDAPTTCIFVHGLGRDWDDSAEGIHHTEEDQEHLLGGNDFLWSHDETIEEYWGILPRKMKDHGICHEILYTKFDTVGSSMDELKEKYEAEFCNLVTTKDTTVIAHSLGNYISGNFECIDKVKNFISLAAPWDMKDNAGRSVLCFGHPFNPLLWIVHFVDLLIDDETIKVAHKGFCDDSFDFMFSKENRESLKAKMSDKFKNSNPIQKRIFICAEDEEIITLPESCMEPPTNGVPVNAFKVKGLHRGFLKNDELADAIRDVLSGDYKPKQERSLDDKFKRKKESDLEL
jgi:hypothetical protein